MVLRPGIEDLKVIGYYLGKILIGLGLTMFVPIAAAVLFREVNPFYDFLISFFICVIFGQALVLLCKTNKDIDWVKSMVIVAIAWLAATVFGALPFYLSGHWLSFLDCAFDSMSGFLLPAWPWFRI